MSEVLARGFSDSPAASKIVELVEAQQLEQYIADKDKFVVIDFYAQ